MGLCQDCVVHWGRVNPVTQLVTFPPIASCASLSSVCSQVNRKKRGTSQKKEGSFPVKRKELKKEAQEEWMGLSAQPPDETVTCFSIITGNIYDPSILKDTLGVRLCPQGLVFQCERHKPHSTHVTQNSTESEMTNSVWE